ncbi:Nucleoside 5-triphosphatase RdgB (dHAPTP, dITP, XTP-specific) [Acidisarcina polymorpha]|uniref:dITP/XTP pyrophosphatase n=1 Tax=Acidisarcina polymorpha TaxID=2211140 RepID=A0A2Z5G8Y2_9BACT|nr:non-canonical purine NTP pyrophosphatase [Acidisarcina polymorpha]AXC15257.1 Nucleoside 5-triphosphatase RdgB (dHAPTP, dITP, XTP-specific) [Acidisarcina polymorpha]
MAAKTLYIATSNPGKLRDFAAAAQALASPADKFAIAPMPCLDRIPPPPEDELTFKGNARAKAIYYSRLAPGFDIIADDSGLEVDALEGEPGVRSARYAEGASKHDQDEANNRLLLKNLASVADEKRTARYRCVLALARDGECLVTAEGSVEGLIAARPQGDRGFGYDPLFYLPELGKTMAEIDLEMKDSISHRGSALRDLFEQLATHLS